MDLVSSFVMLVTSLLASRASVYNYPVVGTVIAWYPRPGTLLMEYTGTDQNRNHGNNPVLLLDDHSRSSTSGKTAPRSGTVRVLICSQLSQIESGRALGTGHTESEDLEIVPLVFVGVASESIWI